MKNKRGWIILALCVLLTAAMIAGGIFLSSRRGKAPVEAGIRSYLDSAMAAETAPNGESNLRRVLINGISYRVLEDSPHAQVAQVEFTYVDLKELQQLASGAYPQDEFFLSCIEIIKMGEAPMCTESIALSYDAAYDQTGRCCVVVETPELVNVLCGGTLDAMIEALKEVCSE